MAVAPYRRREIVLTTAEATNGRFGPFFLLNIFSVGMTKEDFFFWVTSVTFLGPGGSFL